MSESEPKSSKTSRAKRLLHIVRRSALGRNTEEEGEHVLRFRGLKEEISEKAQETIDALGEKYQKDPQVIEKIAKNPNPASLGIFLAELKRLQDMIIQIKIKFLEQRKEDPVNDINDIQKELADWETIQNKLINGEEIYGYESAFREFAEEYEVWDGNPIEMTQKNIHKKIDRAAA